MSAPTILPKNYFRCPPALLMDSVVLQGERNGVLFPIENPVKRGSVPDNLKPPSNGRRLPDGISTLVGTTIISFQSISCLLATIQDEEADLLRDWYAVIVENRPEVLEITSEQIAKAIRSGAWLRLALGSQGVRMVTVSCPGQEMDELASSVHQGLITDSGFQIPLVGCVEMSPGTLICPTYSPNNLGPTSLPKDPHFLLENTCAHTLSIALRGEEAVASLVNSMSSASLTSRPLLPAFNLADLSIESAINDSADSLSEQLLPLLWGAFWSYPAT